MSIMRINLLRIYLVTALAIVVTVVSQIAPARAASKTVAITRQVQQANYYCGPAAVRAALSAAIGSLPSQATLANELGTRSDVGTFYKNIAPVLNRRQSKNNYLTSSVPSGATIMANVKLTIGRYSSAAILPIGGATGHFIVIYGYNDSTNVLSVWDPLNSKNGTMTSAQAYTKARAFSGGAHIIW